jgi:hypothetical protein
MLLIWWYNKLQKEDSRSFFNQDGSFEELFLHERFPKLIRTYKVFLSLEVSIVETNRDQDFSTCRDKLFESDEIFLTVKTSFYTVLVEIFKIETFSIETRLGWDPKVVASNMRPARGHNAPAKKFSNKTNRN